MSFRTFLRLIRMPQWIKNSFVLVPLVFSKHFFDGEYILRSFYGFIAFCFVSSVVYIINDLVDKDEDRLHPTKKERPIASGKVSPSMAIIVAVVFFILNLLFSLQLNLHFLTVSLCYLCLNLFYSFYSKNVVLLDIFSIAAGFMLRVIGGAYAIQVEISSWLLLTTMFLSLFLAVMKRRSELLLSTETTHNNSTRKVLANYNLGFTDQMATISAAAVIICYALYTTAQRTIVTFHTENLIYTTPFVVFGIFRYMYLVYKHDQGENTTEIMLHDKPMIFNILLYTAAIVFIIYKVAGE